MNDSTATRAVDPHTPWLTSEQYALAHRCPTCRVEPGVACVAPRKHGRSHVSRQNAGSRHYSRDIGRAPWPEERIPGKRYDSLGDQGAT